MALILMASMWMGSVAMDMIGTATVAMVTTLKAGTRRTCQTSLADTIHTDMMWNAWTGEVRDKLFIYAELIHVVVISINQSISQLFTDCQKYSKLLCYSLH